MVLKFRRYFAVVAATVVALVVAVVFVPNNPYVRYQSLNGTIHERATWIYERIHFDPTPIDVLFLGSSRVAFDIDVQQIAAMQSVDSDGKPIKYANFSFLTAGENLAYTLLEQVLDTKKPRIVVLGIHERLRRKLHPAFSRLADASDIVAAPVLNWNYFDDLSKLPIRQLTLGYESVVPEAFGYRRNFDPAAYLGSEIEMRHRFIKLPSNGTWEHTDKSWLDAEEVRYRSSTVSSILPKSMEDIEFRAPRYYVRAMAKLAADHGARIVFLYLPSYRGPAAPSDVDFFRGIGTTICPPTDIATNADFYFDPSHLNNKGTPVLTDWFGGLVPALLKGESPASCS